MHHGNSVGVKGIQLWSNVDISTEKAGARAGVRGNRPITRRYLHTAKGLQGKWTFSDCISVSKLNRLLLICLGLIRACWEYLNWLLVKASFSHPNKQESVILELYIPVEQFVPVGCGGNLAVTSLSPIDRLD